MSKVEEREDKVRYVILGLRVAGSVLDGVVREFLEEGRYPKTLSEALGHIKEAYDLLCRGAGLDEKECI